MTLVERISASGSARVIARPCGAPANDRAAKLHFTCLVPENFALWERMALLVQRDLAEIGVDMQLETCLSKSSIERIVERRFRCSLTGTRRWKQRQPAIQLLAFTEHAERMGLSTTPLSITLLTNLVARRTTPNTARRFGSFRQQTFDDPPAIFLALGEITRAVSKRFRRSRACRTPTSSRRSRIGALLTGAQGWRIEKDHVAFRPPARGSRDCAVAGLWSSLDLSRCETLRGGL